MTDQPEPSLPRGAVPANPQPAPGYERRWSDGAGSVRGIRLIALAVAVLLVVWLARNVIAPFVVAAMIAYAFDPLVGVAQKRTGWPRLLIVGLAYVATLVALGVVAYLLAGRLADELHELTTPGGDVVAAVLHRIGGNAISIGGQVFNTDQLAVQINASIARTISSPTSAIHYAQVGIETALQAVLTLILAFYLLLDGDRFAKFGLRFMDRRRQADTIRIAGRIHIVLGKWLRGQLFLIALVAVVLYVLLGPILGVPFSLSLAILSGILEVIPLVGPIVAATIAIAVAFGHGGANLAVVVFVIYLVVRQVEDQVVMPVVIGRAVHLHPVVTIFAVLVGLSTFGVLGGLLGVPVAAAANVTLHELYPEASREPAFFGRGDDVVESGRGFTAESPREPASQDE